MLLFKNISFIEEFVGNTGTMGEVSMGMLSNPLLPLTGTGNMSHSFLGLCRRRNPVIPGLFNQNISAIAFASGIVCLHRRLLIRTSETFAPSPCPFAEDAWFAAACGSPPQTRLRNYLGSQTQLSRFIKMHCLLSVSSADVGKNNRANTLIGKPRACVVFISHAHKVWMWLSYCIAGNGGISFGWRWN